MSVRSVSARGMVVERKCMVHVHYQDLVGGGGGGDTEMSEMEKWAIFAVG
jgi:hypothetical protein